MNQSGTPLLSVTQTRDGVWSVSEKPRCRVAVLARGGAVALSHEYAEAP